MKKYKKDVDLFLLGKNIMITTEAHIQDVDVIYSTKIITGVKPIDRSKFIKPIDLDGLFEKLKGYSKDRFDNEEHSEMDYFKAGYNSNKAEFTREEAKALFDEGCRQGTGNYPLMSFYRCIEILNPLTLPESITINDNDEIVEVVW